MRHFWLAAIFAGSLFSPASADLIKIPAAPPAECGDGRAKLYDACSDQFALFAQAMGRAEAEGKTLLISYGAEWCVWCHVFDKTIEGEVGFVEAQIGGRDAKAEAAALAQWVERSVVLLHVEAETAPNGAEVMRHTGADAYLGKGVPVIFTVDSKGRAAMELDLGAAAIPSDRYRGYDRAILLTQLKLATAAARR